MNTGISIGELAQFVNGEVHGSTEVMIVGVAGLEEAQSGELAFVLDQRFEKVAQESHAAAFVVAHFLPGESRPQIVTANPLFTFTRLVSHYFPPPMPAKGIAPDLAKGDAVSIGPDASIGSFVTLGDRVHIGARVTLYPGVFLGHDVMVGDDAVLYPHVTVLSECRIGARVIIHSGTVIGSDGFGYVQQDGRHQKIPQLGRVVIEDDVELGANVTVDRATFGQTVIKRGTKIDNQVQIAHNVQIGEDCILVSQVGIAGSTTLGHHVLVGGQAGIVDHLQIGDQVKIAAGSGVTKNIEAGHAVGGRMAFDYMMWLKSQALLQKLPDLKKEVQALEARIRSLEEHAKEGE